MTVKLPPTTTVNPLEEKVDVIDQAEAAMGIHPSNREYVMKFVCAALSSEYNGGI